MQTKKESLVSILKFKPWVESKHRITKVTGPCQRAVCFPMGMNLNGFELKTDKIDKQKSVTNRILCELSPKRDKIFINH